MLVGVVLVVLGEEVVLGVEVVLGLEVSVVVLVPMVPVELVPLVAVLPVGLVPAELESVPEVCAAAASAAATSRLRNREKSLRCMGQSPVVVWDWIRFLAGSRRSSPVPMLRDGRGGPAASRGGNTKACNSPGPLWPGS
jgi:hypothetical protein